MAKGEVGKPACFVTAAREARGFTADELENFRVAEIGNEQREHHRTTPTAAFRKSPRARAPLTTFFPKMVEAFAPGYVFLFVCGMMVLHLVWVKTMVIETKGVSLEEIQRKLGIETTPDLATAPAAQL